MRIGRKILALALVLVMVAGVLPATASAAKSDSDVAYAVEGGNIYFDPETGTITGADEEITSAVIPSEIDGVAVTSIGRMAFEWSSLTSVTIPSSVTSIDTAAFWHCDSLTSIAIPEGVKSIGAWVFNDCSNLTSIEIPEGVTSIGQNAFSECDSLTSITIPDSVTSIDGAAFASCGSLTSVTIPEGVTGIGNFAFANCYSLASVTIPEGVTSIGVSAFRDCDSLASVTMPEGVTGIGSYAFGDCDSLASVTIPEGVERIGYEAFAGCESLTSVTIPSSVTSIGERTFLNCTSLTDVYYGGSEAEWYTFIVDSGNDDLLNATIHYNSTMPEPTTPDKPAIVSELAIANTQSVLVDGEQVVFEVYMLENENGGETNYIKLRDLAYILNGTAAQFEVSWDGAVNILAGQAYTPNGSEMHTPFSGDRAYRPTDAVTKVNGVVTEFDAICLEDDNGGEYNYYKLRDLGKALGFDVSWSAEQGIFIETDQPYTDD